MNDIKFFLKFGERKHLEGLQKGELYFSNAKTFRYYEEKLLIKGQGDQLEGGSMFIANNLTKKNPISQEVEFTGIKGNIIHLLKEKERKLLLLLKIMCHCQDGGITHP